MAQQADSIATLANRITLIKEQHIPLAEPLMVPPFIPSSTLDLAKVV
jgi:hypothetical protein